MFVKCSKRVKFTHPENPKVIWEMPAGFIGDVPNWVENHWYFAACCKDGIITAIKSKSDRDIQNATGDNPQGAGGDPAEPPKESGGKKSGGGKK
ncbi:MAG: hypothetical protein NC452_04130 [Eubacterium sp.]|nr:hypothetical protein [Eubacterium sp.]